MTIPAPSLFHQSPHNPEIDELFHQFRDDNIANVLFWANIFDFLVNTSTDFDSILELGVGRCRSLITLSTLVDVYLATSQIKSPVNIYGFDSFRGFPEPSLVDHSQNRQYPQIGEWSSSPSGKYEYTQDFANRVLSLALKPRAYERISLIPDFFSDSVPRFIKDNTPSSSPHADLRIGILHLDGDLYDSVYFPLVAFERYIQPGGLVIFDDFLLTDNPSEDSWPGARRAYVDFMSEFSNNYAHIDNIRGVAVLCKNS